MPTSGLICLTPASELRELLRAGRRRVIVAFRFYYCDYYRDVTIVAVHRTDDRVERVECMFRNGDAITLLLPALESSLDVVGIVDPGRATGKVTALDAPPPLPVRALEEYLRWQEEEILWSRQTTSEDGPYTHHPRLGGLPREVREQDADSIGEGKVIRAIKVL